MLNESADECYHRRESENACENAGLAAGSMYAEWQACPNYHVTFSIFCQVGQLRFLHEL